MLPSFRPQYDKSQAIQEFQKTSIPSKRFSCIDLYRSSMSSVERACNTSVGNLIHNKLCNLLGNSFTWSLLASSTTSLFLALNMSQKNVKCNPSWLGDHYCTCLAPSGCLGNPWQCVLCQSNDSKSSCPHLGNLWPSALPEGRMICKAK